MELTTERRKPTEEELRELYEVQGLSQSQIAVIFDTTQTSVKRWCKKHGINCRPNSYSGKNCNPDGVNTGNPLERTYCPVSLVRLRELYWYHGNDLRDVANHISKIAHTNISGCVVRNWFKIAGIERRSLAHSRFIEAKNTSSWKHGLSKAREALRNSEKARTSRVKHALNIQNKGRLAGMKKAEERRINIKCPQCFIPVSIQPGRFKGESRNFCSSSCAAKYHHHQRKLAKLLPLGTSYDPDKAQHEAREKIKELWGVEIQHSA